MNSMFSEKFLSLKIVISRNARIESSPSEKKLLLLLISDFSTPRMSHHVARSYFSIITNGCRIL